MEISGISGWNRRRPSDKLGLSLARQLLECRQRRGETQQQFAWRFHVSVQTYARWEKYGPPRHRVIRHAIREKLDNLLDRFRSRGRHAKKEKSKPVDAG